MLPGAAPAAFSDIRLQIVASTAAPPDGDGWPHEIKYDGHRLVAIIDGRGRLSLVSRNGY
jgi:ATP-dependent DNA ligase